MNNIFKKVIAWVWANKIRIFVFLFKAISWVFGL